MSCPISSSSKLSTQLNSTLFIKCFKQLQLEQSAVHEKKIEHET